MTDDNKESVGVTGPAGLSAQATGMLTPILFIMALGFGFTIYVSHLNAMTTQKEHEEIRVQMGRMADGIDVQNWLLSIPPDKRPRLLKPYAANRFIEPEVPQR